MGHKGAQPNRIRYKTRGFSTTFNENGLYIPKILYASTLLLISIAQAELSIREKIETKSMPSIFAAWANWFVNKPNMAYAEMTAAHDLFWSPSFGLRFEIIDGKVELLGDF